VKSSNLERTQPAAGTVAVVIGAVAVSAHGHIRATQDLDIVPELAKSAPVPSGLAVIARRHPRSGSRRPCG
jgi:hypothetical protein